MQRSSQRTHRSRTPVLLVGVIVVVLSCLLGVQIHSNYVEQIASAEVSTRNLATLFELRLATTLRSTDADLLALTLEIPIAALNPGNVPFYREEIERELRSRLYDSQPTEGIHVIGADGRTLYGSEDVGSSKMNLADREYFRRLRMGEAGLVISDVLVSRRTGHSIIVLARAVRDEQGTFLGIVMSPLDLGFYRKQIKQVDVGRDGIVALRRLDSHAYVVRSPGTTEMANQPLADSHPVIPHVPWPGGEVTFSYVDPEDHIERIMSIKSMADYPFYFAVGVGKKELLSGWMFQVKVVAIASGLILAVIFLLLARLSRMRVREADILSNLAQRELQYTELSQLVPVGIARFDRAGRHTYVNDRYVALNGRPRGQLIGYGWSPLLHEDDFPMVHDAWNSLKSAHAARTVEYRLVHPDGEVVHVLGEIKVETDVHGAHLGYFAALMDIGQRKKAELELVEAKQLAETANLAKTRFLATASHDLRQPIQAINLFREALSRTELSSQQQSLVEYLSLSVRLLGDLLYSLLDISKLEAGLVRPEMQDYSLEGLMEALDAEFSPIAQQKSLRFKLYYPLPVPVVVTDSALLNSVVRNLVDNALKYTQHGGILIGLRLRNDRVLIQVWDTGIGIDPRFNEQVFEECFQVGNLNRDRNQGLGIGLAIARRTARLLGGDVTFKSRPGRGSMFEVTIPVSNAQQAVNVPEIERMPSAQEVGEIVLKLAGWKVIAVEDDPVVAKSIEFLLQSLGMAPQIFSNAEEALASPDILAADFYLSDYAMPGMNGVQYLLAVQHKRPASSPPMAAVIVTGESSPVLMQQIVAAGWPVLFKPAELTGLLGVFRTALWRREQWLAAQADDVEDEGTLLM